MKNLMDFCFAALGFFIFGYAIAYGGSGPLFGTSGWFMVGVDPATGTLPTSVFWLFQAVFAGTAATIVSGAMAERMRFTAYLMYSFLLTAFIYPVVAHWVWGGGWLAALDFHDFAGSTVVHGVGGTAALVGARLLGPRIGRFNKDGSGLHPLVRLVRVQRGIDPGHGRARGRRPRRDEHDARPGGGGHRGDGDGVDEVRKAGPHHRAQWLSGRPGRHYRTVRGRELR
jgi:ammonia channel protein AmtB